MGIRNIINGRFEENDLSGRKVGKLLVIRRSTQRNKLVYWLCKCECGIYKEILSSHLSGNSPTKSCGCKRKTNAHRTHGLRHHPLYEVWRAMKYRCYNIKSHNYSDYGGRGIKVCDRWRNSFKNFYDDMVDGYVKGEVMIDRERVNGDYEPSNCRWLSYIGSANNKRTSRYLSLNGIVRTAAEWSRVLGVRANTIINRKDKGYPDYVCLSRDKLGTRNNILINLHKETYESECLPAMIS